MPRGVPTNPITDWSEGDLIPRLRELWDEGHSTAEIGQRLGVSKNAVVAKAHQLHLPSRPSPILRREDGTYCQNPAASNAKKVVGPTLLPLPSKETGGDKLQNTPLLPAAASVATPPPRQPVVAVAVAVSPASPAAQTTRPSRYCRVVPCMWPLGETGTRDFRYCDAISEPGRPYCEDHCKVAFVRFRNRREDAA